MEILKTDVLGKCIGLEFSFFDAKNYDRTQLYFLVNLIKQKKGLRSFLMGFTSDYKGDKWMKTGL